jgi:hypothetical protein
MGKKPPCDEHANLGKGAPYQRTPDFVPCMTMVGFHLVAVGRRKMMADDDSWKIEDIPSGRNALE